MRRKTHSSQPKGATLVKLGKDKKGRTVYQNLLTGRNQYLERHRGKHTMLIPAYAFNSYIVPQERGTRKVNDVLKQAEKARSSRLTAKS
jgi:hypothetical protein